LYAAMTLSTVGGQFKDSSHSGFGKHFDHRVRISQYLKYVILYLHDFKAFSKGDDVSGDFLSIEEMSSSSSLVDEHR